MGGPLQNVGEVKLSSMQQCKLCCCTRRVRVLPSTTREAGPGPEARPRPSAPTSMGSPRGVPVPCMLISATSCGASCATRQRRLEEGGLRRAIRCCKAAGTASLVAGRACTLCETFIGAERHLWNSVVPFRLPSLRTCFLTKVN